MKFFKSRLGHVLLGSKGKIPNTLAWRRYKTEGGGRNFGSSSNTPAQVVAAWLICVVAQDKSGQY